MNSLNNGKQGIFKDTELYLTSLIEFLSYVTLRSCAHLKKGSATGFVSVISSPFLATDSNTAPIVHVNNSLCSFLIICLSTIE
jgi:hypothetical protein